MLLRVAAATRRNDVLDAVGAAAGERNPMVGFKLICAAAVGALTAVQRDEIEPFTRRERTCRCVPPGAIVLTSSAADFRVIAVVLSALRDLLLAMPRVVLTPLRVVLVRVRRAPAAHRLARLVSVATDPLAPVRTLIFRVSVRHAFYLAHRRSRVNPVNRDGPARALDRRYAPKQAACGTRYRSTDLCACCRTHMPGGCCRSCSHLQPTTEPDARSGAVLLRRSTRTGLRIPRPGPATPPR